MNLTLKNAVIIGVVAGIGVVALTGCATAARSNQSTSSQPSSQLPSNRVIGAKGIPAPVGLKFYGESQVGPTTISVYTGTGNIKSVRTLHVSALQAAGWMPAGKSGDSRTFTKDSKKITVNYEQDEGDVSVEIRAT